MVGDVEDAHGLRRDERGQEGSELWEDEEVDQGGATGPVLRQVGCRYCHAALCSLSVCGRFASWDVVGGWARDEKGIEDVQVQRHRMRGYVLSGDRGWGKDEDGGEDGDLFGRVSRGEAMTRRGRRGDCYMQRNDMSLERTSKAILLLGSLFAVVALLLALSGSTVNLV
eukprot:750630-Hanusia_phi.AAC.2